MLRFSGVADVSDLNVQILGSIGKIKMKGVSEEFRRSPVSTVCVIVTTIIALLSLTIAWRQSGIDENQITSGEATRFNHSLEVNLENLLLVMAYYLSITTTIALFIRRLAKRHNITAVFASVPLVAVINFTAILIIYLAPPKQLSTEMFSSAHELVKYASAAIFIAVCGKAVLRDLFSNVDGDGENGGKSVDNSAAILAVPLLLLILWTSMIYAGQKLLTETFLPEITHINEAESNDT